MHVTFIRDSRWSAAGNRRCAVLFLVVFGRDRETSPRAYFISSVAFRSRPVSGVSKSAFP